MTKSTWANKINFLFWNKNYPVLSKRFGGQTRLWRCARAWNTFQNLSGAFLPIGTAKSVCIPKIIDGFAKLARRRRKF